MVTGKLNSGSFAMLMPMGSILQGSGLPTSPPHLRRNAGALLSGDREGFDVRNKYSYRTN